MKKMEEARDRCYLPARLNLPEQIESMILYTKSLNPVAGDIQLPEQIQVILAERWNHRRRTISNLPSKASEPCQSATG